MKGDLDLRRLASRTASVLSFPSWAGFVYTLFHRPYHISYPVTARLPDVGLVTVATLFCSLIAIGCALQALGSDSGSASPFDWVVVAACAIPFFGMLWLLDPAGFAPAY